MYMSFKNNLVNYDFNILLLRPNSPANIMDESFFLSSKMDAGEFSLSPKKVYFNFTPSVV